MPFKSIPTPLWRKFLHYIGCRQISVKKHEKWMKEGLLRPVMFSPSKKEIPAMVVRSNLKTLNMTWEQFEIILKEL